MFCQCGLRADWNHGDNLANCFEMCWPGTELNRRRQPFQAYYQLILIIFQQLNFAERPQFCDRSVTCADVRLSVGPPVRGADQVADQNASPRLLPVWPSVILGHWRRVHARAGEALEVVFAHRLHLGWCGPDAAEL